MIRYDLTLIVLLALASCSQSPSAPYPIVVPSSPIQNPLDSPSGQELIDKTKEWIAPSTPVIATELPQINIHSDPVNIINLLTIEIPQTVIFQSKILNPDKINPIQTYQWLVQKLGIPIIGPEDQTVLQGEGQLISFTFSERGRYRITATVSSIKQEVSSSSVVLWAR